MDRRPLPPRNGLYARFGGKKSPAIRWLAEEFGYRMDGNNLTASIAKHLGLRYQHVRNVLVAANANGR